MEEVPLIQGGVETGVLEVYAFPMLDDHGMVTGIVEYIRDITERKRAEQALADSEQRLADIIDFLPDPTWVVDNNGRVIEWNRALERLTGIKKNDIIGKSGYAYAIPFWGASRPVLIDHVLNGDSQWENQYLTLRERDGIAIEGESFHPHMGHGGRYLSGIAGRLYNSEGDVVGAIESVRDITAAKRLENVHARFLGLAHHDDQKGSLQQKILFVAAQPFPAAALDGPFTAALGLIEESLLFSLCGDDHKPPRLGVQRRRRPRPGSRDPQDGRLVDGIAEKLPTAGTRFDG
jgi:PAS domain S-box-containing protein